MTKICNRITIALLVFNLYLVFFLFKGENTVSNFLSLQSKVKVLDREYYSLLKQRYDIGNIHALLQKHDVDSDDVLDGLLRTMTQSSLQSEKIIIFDQ